MRSRLTQSLLLSSLALAGCNLPAEVTAPLDRTERDPDEVPLNEIIRIERGGRGPMPLGAVDTFRAILPEDTAPTLRLVTFRATAGTFPLGAPPTFREVVVRAYPDAASGGFVARAAFRAELLQNTNAPYVAYVAANVAGFSATDSVRFVAPLTSAAVADISKPVDHSTSPTPPHHRGRHSP